MRTNLAERAGRWSAAHWKTATLVWLAFVVIAVALGQAFGTVKLTGAEGATGESARAQAMLEKAGFHTSASESVLVQSQRLTVDDPRFQRTLERTVASLRALEQIRDLRSPLRGNPSEISRDRHAALVQFDIRGPAESADERVQPALDAVAAVQRTSPGFTVAEIGEASANHELNGTVARDFSHAERLSIPATFVVLLIAFGALFAAGVPVLLAFSAVLASLGLMAVLSHLFPTAGATSSVMLLMGMAVGVDYSLFYVKREREERRRCAPRQALARAAASSGRAVLVSGTTVLIAMAGMLFAGSSEFRSIGIGAMLVVLVSMLGSLTVLPALLGKLGDRIERGKLPLSSRRGESRAWSLVLRSALRFPAIAAALAVGLLVVVALPLLHLRTTLPGFTDLPKNLPVVSAYTQVERAFPGAQTPAVVVAQAPNVRAAGVQRAIVALERAALASGQTHEPIEVAVSPSSTVAEVSIPLAGDGNDGASQAALRELRERLLPATLGRVAGVSYAVTGRTAGTQDFNTTTRRHWPLVFAFVLALAFLVLLITFRSLVVPLTAIALNLLSVGAACGALVWIFQDGHLQGPLSFHSDGAVVTWLPLFLFAVLFALSMDYHVFIVSRIKELVDRGVPTEEAVAAGIVGTAGTVTAAAAVMVAVFALFATLDTLELKQVGVGLAVAVLIDATVIRGVLLPASMKLLGHWNWYLPYAVKHSARSRLRTAAS